MLFFLAFEMVLIPMYFLIARWGGEERRPAAWKFILYTLLGSVVMLLGLLLIGLKAGTFDMVALATDNGPALEPHHAAPRRARHRHRPRRQDPDVAAAQLAARTPTPPPPPSARSCWPASC